MGYLKLTNVDSNYKGGAPFVLNLDYILQFKEDMEEYPEFFENY